MGTDTGEGWSVEISKEIPWTSCHRVLGTIENCTRLVQSVSIRDAMACIVKTCFTKSMHPSNAVNTYKSFECVLLAHWCRSRSASDKIPNWLEQDAWKST